jgi:hypothetical protein
MNKEWVQMTSIIQASTVIHRSALPFSSHCVNAASKSNLSSPCERHGTSSLANKTLPTCTLTTLTPHSTVGQLEKNLSSAKPESSLACSVVPLKRERCVQATQSHTISLRFFLISSYYLSTDLPTDPLHLSLRNKPLYY